MTDGFKLNYKTVLAGIIALLAAGGAGSVLTDAPSDIDLALQLAECLAQKADEQEPAEAPAEEEAAEEPVAVEEDASGE